MRKTILWTIVISIVVGFGLATRVTADADQYPNLAGTWTIKVDFNFILDPANPDVTVPFQMSYLQNFTQDGRTTFLLPTGLGHPNAGDTRVGCMGEWRIRPGRGPREYDVALKCMYDQNWDGVYGEIRGVVVLSRSGKTLTAQFSYIDYNADGTVAYDSGRGVMYGTRFEVKPHQ
jgi:hypothetical protein